VIYIPEEIKTFYINGFALKHSRFVFEISFDDNHYFALSPALAKALKNELNSLIKEYENDYGKIPMENIEDRDKGKKEHDKNYS
jgi:hypothetical protein